ncbi:hypothetical protein BU202_08260 [Streptococcus cuniculi]|uniref:Uncharacterized protein n=1 Tax=Streptococcus cuniculi TaxID=1432788 RepID=A0A1Q8E677_9STRE|nr:hypothetical protein [Streptococcus cuniculi]OLF47310.1 hypothetical protein BU202_08260 [Streptococcus cuniculi]QBX23163.1 hypothetical protein Javan116_0034 [Streptococcus phage Javan116]
MRTVNVTILDRLTLETKLSKRCVIWEIRHDYVDNSQTHFELNGDFDIKEGDFILAKFESGEFSSWNNKGRMIPLFLGVIGSSEGKQERTGTTKINAYDILKLLGDVEFPATYKSGNNVQRHLNALIRLYLMQYLNSQLPPISIDDSGAGIPHLYQPSDPPTPTNLMEYAINIFKKYGVSWTVKELRRRSDGRLLLETRIEKPKGRLRFKNNVSHFMNWSVYVTPANEEGSNHLLIVDKKTRNSEQPIMLAQYFLGDDGTISQDRSAVRSHKLFQTKVHVYDTEQEDKPSYDDVARSELSASSYSHEISFDIPYDSDICQLSDLRLGIDCTIYYDKQQYPSILTGYSLSSKSDYISLKFGNVRSTLKSIVKGKKK